MFPYLGAKLVQKSADDVVVECWFGGCPIDQLVDGPEGGTDELLLKSGRRRSNNRVSSNFETPLTF